jgi:hypothetical protein
MASVTVRIHRLAAREYQAGEARYARRSARAARRFRDEVRRLIQRIEQTPDQGSIYRDPYRWMRVRRFPYLLYYGPFGSAAVMIYAVAHASRRPGYWLRRTGP